MEAYESYRIDPKGGSEIVGVLPERRKKHERITQKSIKRWGEGIFGKDSDTNDMFFTQVTIEKTIRIYRLVPFVTTQKDI
jgi:hypothetical protein